MNILTDEMIEIAARAAYESLDGIPWEKMADLEDFKSNWFKMSRAALTAALPSIIEACAKMAEAHLPAERNPADPLFKCYKAVEIVARAIRSLIPASQSSKKQKE